MAETGGSGEQLSATLFAGSDFTFDYICQLCQEEDRQVEAVGYCVDCSDYLCDTCYKYHCKPRPSRHHVLLDQEHMPKPTDAANVTRKTAGKASNDKDKSSKALGQNTSQINNIFQRLVFKSESTRPLCNDPKHIAVNHVTDINVKLDSDRQVCLITGSVVLPGQRLVICDYENKKIKVIDMTKETVVSVLQLDRIPWDMAQVNSAELVITIPGVALQFLSLTPDNKLSLGKKVSLKGECRGIACTKDKIIVAFCNPAKVQVMDMNCVVMKTITIGDTGKQLFRAPWYVVLSPSQDIIYVSDRGMDTVTCLTMDGQVIAVYREGKLGLPSKPGVDKNGTVYIAWYKSNHMYMLNSKLEKIKKLTIPGPKSPRCLSICEESDSIIIGQQSDNIKIVQFS